MTINSRTIFYKELQAFPNLCVFAFENVVFQLKFRWHLAILQNSKNLKHLFLTLLFFRVTVICDYSIDLHKTFTEDLKLMEKV